MGYSHYWNIKEELTPAQFKEWADGVKIIVEIATEAGIKLGNGLGFDAPRIEETYVAFNGVGGEGHETFTIALDDTGFNFCKTGEKPYDTVVTASLILLKATLGENVIVSSDGNWSNWEGGILLYETVFAKTPEPILARTSAN